jgi:hypothetical protein
MSGAQRTTSATVQVRQNGGPPVWEGPAPSERRMIFDMLFSRRLRLVIDGRGAISVYDKGSHCIFGVAQAQSRDRTLSFTSHDGLVRVADLQKVTT